MKRLHLKIFGRVQGVFFREYTRKKAEELGLRGWVCNRDDGTVELIAEGGKEDLRALYKWCQEGPPSARVENIDLDWQEASGEFGDFIVLVIP